MEEKDRNPFHLHQSTHGYIIRLFDEKLLPDCIRLYQVNDLTLEPRLVQSCCKPQALSCREHIASSLVWSGCSTLIGVVSKVPSLKICQISHTVSATLVKEYACIEWPITLSYECPPRLIGQWWNNWHLTLPLLQFLRGWQRRFSFLLQLGKKRHMSCLVSFCLPKHAYCIALTQTYENKTIRNIAMERK